MYLKVKKNEKNCVRDERSIKATAPPNAAPRRATPRRALKKLNCTVYHCIGYTPQGCASKWKLGKVYLSRRRIFSALLCG